MRRIAISTLALLTVLGGCGPKPPPANVTAAVAPVAKPRRPIPDPVAFVTEVYGHLAKSDPYNPPEDIYTPHLQGLWDAMAHDYADGQEVGPIDFEFWTNSQDWQLKDVTITSLPVEKHTDRKVVIAKFKNIDRAEEVHFYFEQTGANWLLDDARSVGKQAWTLSTILKYGWDDPNGAS